MKRIHTLALTAVIAGLLMGAVFGTGTTTADLSDAGTLDDSELSECSTCPNNPYGCTQAENCGRSSCGALQGKSCGCGR